MRKLLIIGAGGHGSVVADAAQESGEWEEIAFLDDKFPDSSSNGVWQIIGTEAETTLFKDEYDDLIVAIGDSEKRLGLLEKYKHKGFKLVNVIHPSAYVSENALLDVGCVVFANAVININTKIGAGSIVNTSSSVDHDCELGDGVHVSPGAHLAGNVRVGKLSWIGIGSCVTHGVTIGKGVNVGAGAVVINDLPDDITAIGVPAKQK